ncbi:T9SS type A sorting domain-containing protein [Spirosoma fluviale]|uniref:T9SS type A sorting domain-containing protein n=1 Tax=Spirosoma fluviale TaxID=1597977 RepID=UPI001FE58280|nr:T9SS type A sorting domain-containing protein [Spirosoma fluviale]
MRKALSYTSVDDFVGKQNLAKKVTVMTFSEFGRRVNQNGTNGTDHGTAAPLFVIGDPVRGGIVGAAPVLSDVDSNGDLKFKNDFRQVYASVLRDHLGVDASTTQTILGREFESLPIFRQAPILDAYEGMFSLGQNTPNPFAESTEIQFSINQAGTVRLALYDLTGREIIVLHDGRFDRGNCNVTVSGANLTAGHYLYSLRTDNGRQVKRLIKL